MPGQRVAGERDDGMCRVRSSALSRRVASQPSITGSDRSIRMMSGSSSQRLLERLHAVGRLDDVEAGELQVLGVHLARVLDSRRRRARSGRAACLSVIAVLCSPEAAA